MLPCMFKSYFGIDCIGCGIQRSVVFLIHGEFENAFYMFPAIYTTILFFMLIGMHVISNKFSFPKIIIGLAIGNALILVFSYLIKLQLINLN
ncbi:MAG: hypothetical protein ACI9XR_000962 [Flavobacterium sp.]|jgi:hypothetical protein